MKRLLALVLAVLILATLAGALAGCGGDTAQAKADRKNADLLWAKVVADSNQVAGKVTAAYGDITDPAKFKAAVDGLNAFLDGIDKKVEVAQASYQKIKTLKGVPDYATYAGMQVDLNGLIKEMTSQLKTLLTQLQEAVTAADQAKLDSIQQNFEPAFTALSDKVNKLENQAKQFKADKNL